MTDGYSEWVKTFRAGGVPVVKYTAAGFESGIAKFIGPIAEELKARLGLEVGDAVLLPQIRGILQQRRWANFACELPMT